MAAAPDGLTVTRHRDLAGRTRQPWIRRTILAVLSALVLAALLNVFGEHPTTSRAGAAAASLEVQSPTRLRGGLIFQARFTIAAVARIAKPALVLSRGWFESMSINSIIPDATEQTSRDDTVRLTFDPIPAGHTSTVWIYFQVNPTNVGERSEDTELADGGRPLVRIARSITIFP